MKEIDPRCEATVKNETLAIDQLVTADERRTSTIEKQIAFRESITRPCDRWDEIDREIDDMTILDPYEIHAPSRKSDAELNRVLSILDNLKSGKEATR